MFYIYTKEKIAKVKFSVNLTAKEVKEFTGNNLFLDYPELNKDDYVVVESNEVFKHPTYDSINNTIREMTRNELVAEGIEITLENGEIIKNKKLIKVQRPSQFHQWDGNKWFVNLDELKNTKREELKRIRAKKIDSDLEVNGDYFQVRERDLNNFYNIKTVADLNPAIKSQKVTWILADNTSKEFTYEQIMNVLIAYIMRKQELFAKFAILAEESEKAKTVNELEAIKWE